LQGIEHQGRDQRERVDDFSARARLNCPLFGGCRALFNRDLSMRTLARERDVNAKLSEQRRIDTGP
jgi:hypothetical protein